MEKAISDINLSVTPFTPKKSGLTPLHLNFTLRIIEVILSILYFKKYFQ
jgi:hypothetical protein